MKTIKFIAKVLVAAIVAMGVAFVLVWQGASFQAVAVVYGCTAIMTALVLGAFDVPAKRGEQHGKYDSIKHKMGIKYNQAAIFVGTACLFIGSPDECDEVVDDLWHHAHQAEVRALTGDETFDIL